MKVALLVLALVAVVLAEDCKHNSTVCQETSCTDTTHNVICVHNTCTCSTSTTHACSLQSDCDSNTSCSGHDSQHCVDGTCKCLHGPANGNNGHHQQGQHGHQN